MAYNFFDYIYQIGHLRKLTTIKASILGILGKNSLLQTSHPDKDWEHLIQNGTNHCLKPKSHDSSDGNNDINFIVEVT